MVNHKHESCKPHINNKYIEQHCKKFSFKEHEESKTDEIKNYQYIPGDVRLSYGLYQTPSEKEEYIEKSLRKKLP